LFVLVIMNYIIFMHLSYEIIKKLCELRNQGLSYEKVRKTIIEQTKIKN
jgi:hypothetical protein